MHAIHLISNLTCVGGPAMTVPEMCNALADSGIDVELFAIARGPVESAKYRFGLREFPSANYLRQLSISPEMYQALKEAARAPVVLHSHSVWSMLSIYPSWVERKNKNVRTVIAPHGTLAPFAFRWRWWRKAPFWWLAQKRALETCDCLHSTGEGESRDIRAIGLKQPIINIPHVILMPAAYRVPPDPKRRRRLLYLGRLHPIKGLETLLRTWRQVQEEFPDWELQLVGPEDFKGYHQLLQTLGVELGCERVSFHGSVLDAAKDEAYDQADLFILPSISENFGLVVAEALAHGVPAIVCKGAPWAGLEENRCGWWVDNQQGAIAEALRAAMSMSDPELRSMGQSGREWVGRDFSEQRVAQLIGEAYRWLLGGGPVPAFVDQ
jgi:glycosyltransferase involved in cell wall biosynthesis